MVWYHSYDASDVDELIFGGEEQVMCSERYAGRNRNHTRGCGFLLL